jgi:hypothetical protein
MRGKPNSSTSSASAAKHRVGQDRGSGITRTALSMGDRRQSSAPSVRGRTALRWHRRRVAATWSSGAREN